MACPAFSIVIPARDARGSLSLVLRCLERQDAPSDMAEILIVDDGSTDGTAAMLRQHRSRFALKFWSNPVSLGRSSARNLAWRESAGEVVLFLDADMLPEPTWLQGFAQAFASSEREVISGGRYSVDLGSDPGRSLARLAEIVGISPERLFLSPEESPWQMLVAVAHLGQYPHTAHGPFEEQLRIVCREHPDSLLCAYSLITSNVGVRRGSLERVNGFDPFIRRGQDTDLGFRLWEASARFDYAPASRAYHLYTFAERDRQTDIIEYSAFFHRFPYMLVPFVYLWFVYHAPGSEAPPLPFLRSLSLLAAQGQALMDVDVAREFFRLHHGRLPADCQFSKEAVAIYLAEVTGIAREQAEGCLEAALAQGLFAQRRNGRVYLDMFHTRNWLRQRTRWQEHESTQVAYMRQVKTAYFHTREPASLHSLRCSGAYEIAIDLRAIAGEQSRATLNIALPIETSGQTRVRLVDCCPDDLLDHLDPTTQLIRNYPIQATKNGPTILRYHFTCETHERSALNGTRQDAADAVISHGELRLTYPPATVNALKSLLLRIPIPPGADSIRAAREIYTYLLDNTRRLQSTLPDYTVVTTGLGPCVHRTRLFVHLCLLLDIPAREQCGAMLEGPFDPDKPCLLETRERGYSPFLHTWAEFYAPEQGWIPVELMAAAYGKRLLTPLNVQDSTLRHTLEQETAAFDTYYFGAIDPYRILCSAAINRHPVLPTVVRGADRIAPHKLWWYTRHRLSVEIVPLSRDTP